MKHGKFTLVGIAALVLCGCPAPGTEFRRTMETTVQPDAYCLIDALREVADGRAVNYSVQDTSVATAHSYTYMRSMRHLSWWITERKEEGIITIMHRGVIGDSQPEELPKLRKDLRDVEALLKNRCGLGTQMDYARESCMGKACGKSAP